VSVLDALLVAVAGLLCGGINAVAGGGSLVLFPALIATGMPTLAANVTNSVCTWPGYVGGIIGFRKEVAAHRQRVVQLAIVTLAGSTTGCVLLLVTPSSAFDLVVPGLVAFACLLLAIQPWVRSKVGEPKPDTNRERSILFPAIFAATVYGGYFGGALGVIILGVLALTLAGNLRDLNVLKACLSLVDCTVSVVVFGLFGPVHWLAVLVAAPSTLLGGYLGARVARKLNEKVLRYTVITFGLGVAAYLAVRAIR